MDRLTVRAAHSPAVPGEICRHLGEGGGLPSHASHPQNRKYRGSDHSDGWRNNDDQRRLVKILRHVTDDYRWLENAEADGYQRITECVENPGVGAMGFHYAKQEMIDDKTQARKPEVLVYMQNRYGRYKLVAAEFISTAAERPSIAGLDFEDGPFPGSFALHAWVWRDNPNGPLAAYNPDLSCPK